MTAIALTPDKNNDFDISFENGMLKREEAEISFAKHNLLCFGRAPKQLTDQPLLRRGNIIESLEGQCYSLCWLYYLEGSLTFDNMSNISREFLKACNRDFANSLFDNKINILSVSKLDKNTINFTISFGSTTKDITITI